MTALLLFFFFLHGLLVVYRLLLQSSFCVYHKRLCLEVKLSLEKSVSG